MDVTGSVKYYYFALPSLCRRCKIMHLIILYEVQKMSEKEYKKRLEFQQKMIKKQSEQMDLLKEQIEILKNEIKEKDELINSISPLRKELIENAKECKKYKEEYKSLLNELKKMKEIINKEVYKGRWKIVKFLIK